jgi:hypothetical protein
MAMNLSGSSQRNAPVLRFTFFFKACLRKPNWKDAFSWLICAKSSNAVEAALDGIGGTSVNSNRRDDLLRRDAKPIGPTLQVGRTENVDPRADHVRGCILHFWLFHRAPFVAVPT